MWKEVIQVLFNLMEMFCFPSLGCWAMGCQNVGPCYQEEQTRPIHLNDQKHNFLYDGWKEKPCKLEEKRDVELGGKEKRQEMRGETR